MTGPTPLGAPRTIEDAYRTERRKLLRYLQRRAGHDDAPDLVQEVFVRALGSRQAGRIDNPAAFLRRVARNLLIDRARHRISNPVTMVEFDERDVAVQPQQSWAIEAADLMAAYQQAIDAMSPKTRAVFLLHRIEGISYREIGDRLGIGNRGVEYHMMRALSLCRHAISVRR